MWACRHWSDSSSRSAVSVFSVSLRSHDFALEKPRLLNAEIGNLKCGCSPAQSPEPGQLVGMVNSVADGDDLLETLDLDSHDLQRDDNDRKTR